MGDWKKLSNQLALCFFLSVYMIILHYNPYLRYWAYHFWGAIGSYSMGNRSPVLTILNALICSGLMIGIVYFYTLDKKYINFTILLFGLLYSAGFGLYIIEKFVNESLVPDEVNNAVELLTIQPTLLIILLGGYHLHQMQRFTS